MISMTPQSTNSDLLSVLESIGYFAIIMSVVGATIVFIVKTFVVKMIDRYYDSIDKRNTQFEKFSLSLTDIVGQMQRMVDSMEAHKEYDEEFRTTVDSKFVESTVKTKEIFKDLEAKLKHGIDDVRKDIESVKISEKEHYQEIKGKVSKQWESIATVREAITKIEAYYNNIKNYNN